MKVNEREMATHVVNSVVVGGTHVLACLALRAINSLLTDAPNSTFDR